MTTHDPRLSTAYQEFVGLLRTLHSLIAGGLGDSDEADAIRDQMDAPWGRLSEQEMERTRGLAGDLNSVYGDEIYSFEDVSNPVLEDDLRNAMQAEDYDRVLTLLHRPAPFLKADEIAFMRGHCWGQLGDLESALLFYRRAADLTPADKEYAVMLMSALLLLGRLSEAAECANRLADDVSVTIPAILLQAAGVLFASVDDISTKSSQPSIIRVVELIHTAFEMDLNAPVRDRLRPADKSRYLVILAMCQDTLGRRNECRDTLKQALEIDPGNVYALNALVRDPQANGNSLNGRQSHRRAVVSILEDAAKSQLRIHNFHATSA